MIGSRRDYRPQFLDPFLLVVAYFAVLLLVFAVLDVFFGWKLLARGMSVLPIFK